MSHGALIARGGVEGGRVCEGYGGETKMRHLFNYAQPSLGIKNSI